MRKFINLTGDIYGNLTVIKLEERKQYKNKIVSRWLCKCSCGNEKILTTGQLRNSNRGTKSCGCLRTENIRKKYLKDLTGKVFCKLLVIKRVEDKIFKCGSKSPMWQVKCDCGNYKIVSGKGLKNGDTKSCGCYKKSIFEKKLFKNLTGKRYGKLKVISIKETYLKGKIKKITHWLCLCDCGNEVMIQGNHLRSGSTQSCGCLKESIIAYKIKKYCVKNKKAVPEYKKFKNPETNRYLPFDIFIPSINMFIEIHGLQHYKFNKHFHRTKKNFEYSKYKDKIKKNFAEKNGVYIEVDLRKIKTVKAGILYLKSKLKIYE